MLEGHPASVALRRFVEGELPPQDNVAVVRHLLDGCAQCAGRTATHWRELIALRGDPRQSAEAPSWRAVAERIDACRAGIEMERREAHELFEKLAAQPPKRRLLWIRNSHRYDTPAACLQLIEAAFDLCFDEPHQGVATAELALAVARALDKSYGAELIADIEGRAWGVLGNSRRIVSDLGGAEQALKRARERLDEGTGDPIETARLTSFLSTQRIAQRRFDEALQLCRRAGAGYRRAGEDQLAAQMLVDEGVVLGHLGRYDEAVRKLGEALERVDPRQLPRNLLAARHNQILFLEEAGRTEEALALVPVARQLARHHGRRIDQLRVHWLEARLLAAVGRYREAASGLGEVADAFLREEMPYAAAIAALERATLLFRLGRTDEIRQIAAEALSVFRSLGIEREALMAVTLLRQAAEREELTLALLERAVAAVRSSPLPS
jgi:tetratricopeptide (TPR) repeat protein